MRSRIPRASWLLAVLVAGIGGSAIWLGREDPRGRDPGAATPRIPAAPRVEAPDDSSGPAGEAAARVAVETVAPAPSEPDRGRGRPRSFPLRGRVLDADGEPVGGVDVGFAASTPGSAARGLSDADGIFAIEVQRYRGTLVATDPRWETLRAGDYVADSDREHVLVVAPSIAVGGWVVDGGGEPVGGAKVEVAITLPESREWVTRSDEGGRFDLPGAPALRGARLAASHEGYLSGAVELPTSSSSQLQIVLERAPGGPVVTGSVVHADGRPAAGAVVLLGRAKTDADAAGAFRLALDRPAADAPLLAKARRFLPAVLPAFGARVQGGMPPPEPVRLVLGGPALRIEGRVVDAGGHPLKRWWVLAVEDEGPPPPAGGPYPGRTDKEGRFIVDDLSPRAYRLLAWGTGPPDAIRSGPIEAGARDVLLVVPEASKLRSLRGRVRSLDGRPLAGVSVGTEWLAPVGRAKTGARVATDALGRFELPGVPRTWIRLTATGQSILPASLVLLPSDPGQEVLLEAATRRSFVFECGLDAAIPDSLEVLDAVGLPLDVWSAAGGSPTRIVPLTAGRSAPLSVSEAARTLIVVRGSRELARIELNLREGETVLVRGP